MKCAILLAEGFEDCEALITVDMLRRGNVEINTVSITSEKAVKASHDVVVNADLAYDEFDPAAYDVLILPGGKLGTDNIAARGDITSLVKKHFDAGKLTCAICAAPSILGRLGILKGRHYTCFPGFESEAYGGTYEKQMAVADGNLITGRGMGATIEFARTILKRLVDDKTLAAVEYGIQYEHSFMALTYGK